jgi:hypothetical protein
MRTLSWTLSCLAASLLFTAPAKDLGVQSHTETTRWTVSYAGKPVMVYEFLPTNYKPCVKELYTLKGQNVLRDAPADHLHHHALMYGIRVNGVNFWEEIAGSGVQKVVRSSPPQTGTSPDGLPQATLAQELFWLTPETAFLPNTNAPALLVEERVLTVAVDEPRQEVALRWHSLFRVGSRTNTVFLAGANYHGLGMRFLQALDPVATHFYPEGEPDLSNNKQDVSPHKWEAVRFSGSNPATIVLLGHRSNARGDARFFSMRTPFAYLAATQGLDREPLVYQAGQTFELNYLVLLYPEEKASAALNDRARLWEEKLR